jgi:hypothetical protein
VGLDQQVTQTVDGTPAQVGPPPNGNLDINLNGIGNAIHEMSILPTVAIGSGVLDVALGGAWSSNTAYPVGHTCAIIDDGTGQKKGPVKCWGDDSLGQLGRGGLVRTPVGRVAGEISALTPINLGTDDMGVPLAAKRIVAGVYHTCVIVNTGQVKCWGANDFGQLGQGSTAAIVTSPSANSAIVNLGSGRTAKDLAAGLKHTCAILDNSDVKCWGHNEYGQIGLGTVDIIGDVNSEMGDSLPIVSLGTGRKAIKIAAGWHHTCVVLDNSEIKCFGYNGFGALGMGLTDTDHRGDANGEMGDALTALNLGTGLFGQAFCAP